MTLNQEAQNKLREITIQEVKSIIETLEPKYYKKILIGEDTPLKRSNYVYVKYLGKEVERNEKKLAFPLYGQIIEDFKEYEGGVKKFKKDKVAMTSEQIFDDLREIYKILPEDEHLSNVPNWNVYYLKTDENQLITAEQEKYFLPALTDKYTDTAEFLKGPVEGAFGKVVYIETVVENHPVEKLFPKDGDKLNEAVEEEIKNHCPQEPELTLMYSDRTGLDSRVSKIKDAHDEFSTEFAQTIRQELATEIIEEQIYYQIIPCIELSYLHVLTNTWHEMTMINVIDEDPHKQNVQLVFHSSPEDNKNQVADTAKKVSGFFSKMMKTKAHKSKEDRKNEIALMIRIARADGELHDSEKLKLSNIIGGIDEFTYNEKQFFYELMTTDSMPDISDEEITFSDEETKERVLKNLEEIAQADEELREKEQRMLEKVKRMVKVVS